MDLRHEPWLGRLGINQRTAPRAHDPILLDPIPRHPVLTQIGFRFESAALVGHVHRVEGPMVFLAVLCWS